MNKSRYKSKDVVLERIESDPSKPALPSLSRRSFLAKGSMAVAGAGMLCLGVGGVLVAPSAWAAAAVGDHASATLLRMARDIYPHDTLEDKYYTQVLLPMGENAATDNELAKLLTEGVEELDTRAQSRFGRSFLEIEQEPERVEILRDIEASAFFQKIKGAVMMGIYNNPELWPRFGYGGSSWEHGGYINRGFDKIDWL